jgi:hypothetical protein
MDGSCRRSAGGWLMSHEEVSEEFKEQLREILREEIRKNNPWLATYLGLWCPICGADTLPGIDHPCITSLPKLKGIIFEH